MGFTLISTGDACTPDSNYGAAKAWDFSRLGDEAAIICTSRATLCRQGPSCARLGQPGRLSLRSPAPGDRLAGFLVGSAAALGFAFIPLLFALGQGKLNFDFSVLEVHASGNQGQALLLGLADELANFFFVDQQFSGAQSGMVGG